MYAVIATGGKQYRVEKGGVLRIEKLNAEPGSTVEFNEVLMVADGDVVRLGKPLLAATTVRCPRAVRRGWAASGVRRAPTTCSGRRWS